MITTKQRVKTQAATGQNLERDREHNGYPSESTQGTVTCPCDKAIWSLFFPIMFYTSRHNRPNVSLSSFAESRNKCSFFSGRSEKLCCLESFPPGPQAEQVPSRLQRSHLVGGLHPPQQRKRSNRTGKALERVLEKPKGSCFPCQALNCCHMTQFPACSAGLPGRASKVPGCGIWLHMIPSDKQSCVRQ